MSTRQNQNLVVKLIATVVAGALMVTAQGIAPYQVFASVISRKSGKTNLSSVRLEEVGGERLSKNLPPQSIRRFEPPERLKDRRLDVVYPLQPRARGNRVPAKKQEGLTFYAPEESQQDGNREGSEDPETFIREQVESLEHVGMTAKHVAVMKDFIDAIDNFASVNYQIFGALQPQHRQLISTIMDLQSDLYRPISREAYEWEVREKERWKSAEDAEHQLRGKEAAREMEYFRAGMRHNTQRLEKRKKLDQEKRQFDDQMAGSGKLLKKNAGKEQNQLPYLYNQRWASQSRTDPSLAVFNLVTSFSQALDKESAKEGYKAYVRDSLDVLKEQSQPNENMSSVIRPITEKFWSLIQLADRQSANYPEFAREMRTRLQEIRESQSVSLNSFLEILAYPVGVIKNSRGELRIGMLK